MVTNQVDPAIGSWRLKAEGSQGQGIPQWQEMQVQTQDEMLLVSITGAFANGSPINVRYTVPPAGGEGRMMDGPFDRVFSEAPEGKMRRLRYFKDGKEVTSVEAHYSDDGRSLTLVRKGMSVLGEEAPARMAFERVS